MLVFLADTVIDQNGCGNGKRFSSVYKNSQINIIYMNTGNYAAIELLKLTWRELRVPGMLKKKIIKEKS